MLYNTFNHHTDPRGFVKLISLYGVFSSCFLRKIESCMCMHDSIFRRTFHVRVAISTFLPFPLLLLGLH